MNWLLIIIIVLALFALLKMSHFRHRLTTIVIVCLFLFIYVSFSVVANNNSVDLSTASGLFQASKIYFSWFGQAFGNMKSITGNVIGMDWLPENKTIIDMDPRTVMKG